MKDDRGISLVELLVVLAVIIIAMALIIPSFNSVYSAQVMQCAEEVDALLAKSRVGAMSRDADVYLELHIEDDGVYAAYHEGDTIISDDKVGKATVSVSYATDKAPTPVRLQKNNSLFLSFDRGTGASKTMGLLGPDEGNAYCTEIVISNGSRSKKIVLAPLTGKHYVD